MPVAIRLLDERHVEEAFALRSQSFSTTRESFDPQRPHHDAERDRLLGAFDGGRMVGTATVHGMGQYFGGRSVPMGAVAGVAIAPDARGQGVGRELMHAAIAALRQTQRPISTLYPATTVFYRALGWEIAGTWTTRRVPTRTLARLPPPAAPPALRPADGSQVSRLRACYDRVARTRNGWLDRDPTYWARLRWDLGREGGPHRQQYVAERDGEVVAYLRYRHVEEDPRFYGLHVDDLVSDDHDATLALLRLLAGNRSVTDQVKVKGAPHDPLTLLLPEQDLRTDDEWRWMTRLIDAAGAVAARGYLDGVTCRVELEVDDPLISTNAGRRVLEVEGGEGRLVAGGAGTTRMGINALSSLYTGWASPWTLADLGMVTCAAPRELAVLAGAFAGPPPWTPDFF
ncbi:MAG TPA: GNAT family N-acetyltransferase [Nitriliruptorales bacterium]|nr:GNAT family N-acetyltransferase [Nitriliruptorales bacterium]